MITESPECADPTAVGAAAEAQRLFAGQTIRPKAKGNSCEYRIFGVHISSRGMRRSIEQVSRWARQRKAAKLVTFTNVHMVTEGHKNASFRSVHRQMDMNCPDGMPIVWLGKALRHPVERVSGPDFMQKFCAQTRDLGLRHFFYGGGDGIAQGVISQLEADYPGIQIVGSYTPPFRPLSAQEDDQIVTAINNSDVDVLWVCLGCPKQEIWMHEHRDRLNVGVMLAVGQAFDISAGAIRRAPALLRDHGFEWLYRLGTDPKRLARRYFTSNTLFLRLLAQATLFRVVPSLRQRTQELQ